MVRVPPPSRWAEVRLRFRARPGAMLALMVLMLIVLLVLAGPWLWPVAPDRIDLRARNLGFGWAHPLGTDQLGRDLLARLMAGGRLSLAVGGVATVVSVGVGGMIGVMAGYWRRLDGVLMRLTDLFLALPLLPVLLLATMLFRESLARTLGPATGTFVLIVLGIGLTSWMQVARVMRAEVRGLRSREFILAAEASGTPPGRMIRRHLLPNAASALTVSTSLGVAGAILTESALSFLGLGFPPDQPSWGRLLFDAVEQIGQYPARAVLPGALIALTVLSVNAIGEGLREAMDARR